MSTFTTTVQCIITLYYYNVLQCIITLAKAIRQEDIKEIQVGEEKIKQSLLVVEVIYIKNPKDFNEN